jgi:hypothetical protein
VNRRSRDRGAPTTPIPYETALEAMTRAGADPNAPGATPEYHWDRPTGPEEVTRRMRRPTEPLT